MSYTYLAREIYASVLRKSHIEIVNGLHEFEPSIKSASGLRKAIRYAVRSELRCPVPCLPSKGELLGEIERSRGRTVARKSAVKTKEGK